MKAEPDTKAAGIAPAQPAFHHRAYYINFASHLLNAWNVNLIHPQAGQRWELDEFRRLFAMIKAFGFTCFEFWLEPTIYKSALDQDAVYREFVRIMPPAIELAHQAGLLVKYGLTPNCIGHAWYSACPNLPADRALIERLWRHWAEVLRGADFVGIFPGDPGGCRRHGCDHRTFIELALRLTEMTLRANPAAVIEVGTWGTPFAGWGEDMRFVPDWDGSWQMLTQGMQYSVDGVACQIWNGTPGRARRAMGDFIARLPEFPANAVVGINLGFSPDADALAGGDAREYVREIAKIRRISSWDYAVTEGELVTYPHWRVPRIFSRRREERGVAPYYGAMSYTMSPKLSHLSMYAAAQAALNPDRDPDAVSREFCRRVFGPEHEILGELFEAFEVAPGWGHYPRRKWAPEEAHRAYLQIADHLEQADMRRCDLPLFPSPEEYRTDLLWFARMFVRLAAPNPDREAIRQAYWKRSLSIYDQAPMSVDERAGLAARAFSRIFEKVPPSAT